jgi:hypothetical protein
MRLVHYADGSEELYETETDPYEWNNLAIDRQFDAHRDELRNLAPTKFATAPRPTVDSLTSLVWQPLSAGAVAPASKPDGNSFDVVFINSSEKLVQLWWMSPEGAPKPYESLSPGKQLRRKTRPGAVWMIRGESENNLGYFRVDDRSAKAIIPPN